MIAKRWFQITIVILVVTLSVGQVLATTTYRVDHMATATMITAGLAITAAAEYAIASCAAWCATAWSAVTFAAAATAELLSIGLFYGTVVGLGAVSVYMLYKGLSYVNGVLTAPSANPGLTPGHVGGPTTWTRNGVTFNVVGYCCDCGGWCSKYGDVCNNGDYDAWCNASRVNGHPFYYYYQGDYTRTVTISSETNHVIAPGQPAPVTLVDMQGRIASDLAGTNGAQAKALSLKAAQEVINKYAQLYPQAVDAVNWGKDLPVPFPGALPVDAWKRVAQIFVDAMPASAQAKLGDYQNARDNVAYGTNPQTASMTKTDFRDAVRDGVKEAVEDAKLAKDQAQAAPAVNVTVNIPPVDYTPPADVNFGSGGNETAPALTPIGTKLDTFYTAISSLPVLSLITSMHVDATGGSPVVEMTIPGFFGQAPTQKTLDFSNDSMLGIGYSSVLSMLGNLMLAFCGVQWTKYLFEG